MAPFGANFADWLLLSVNAAMVALLFRAAAAKLVQPGVTVTSLAEVWPKVHQPGVKAVRLLAAVEVAAGFAIAVPALRRPGQFLVVLLGGSFLGMGMLGMIRKGSRPCGCFGAESGRPLGLTSILVGSAFLAGAIWNLFIRDPDSPNTLGMGTVTVALFISVAWLLATHRRLAAAVARKLLRRAGLA